MIINILCDDKNSWFWDKNNNLIKEIEKTYFEFNPKPKRDYKRRHSSIYFLQ